MDMAQLDTNHLCWSVLTISQRYMSLHSTTSLDGHHGLDWGRQRSEAKGYSGGDCIQMSHETAESDDIEALSNYVNRYYDPTSKSLI